MRRAGPHLHLPWRLASYESEVSSHPQGVGGFRGARLLRKEGGQEVMFTSVTFSTSVDAVRGFAGEDYEQAVVEELPVGR
jgi:hypothetical protein